MHSMTYLTKAIVNKLTEQNNNRIGSDAKHEGGYKAESNLPYRLHGPRGRL